jgi:hypothetical protein
LEVIGINLDTDKETVEKLIADKSIPWPQYFDGREWDNRFVRQFGVKTVPTMWLIGKDGKLAHSDVDWSDPGPKVKRALGGLPLTDEQPGPPWPGLSEADKKALADFKEAYALAEGQDLKFMGQPFLPSRLVYYRLTDPTQAQLIPRGPDAYYFSWREGLLQYGMSFGKQDVRTVLRMVARMKAYRIEGDEELLGTGISGDFIVREGVPAEKIVRDLEAMLRRDLRLAVKMGFGEVEREVIVARGSYRFAPVPDHPPDRIELYGEKLDDPSLGDGGSGDLVKFLWSVGRYLDKQVVNEVDSPPEGILHWHNNYRREGSKTPDLVLQHLTEQTGLTFTKETRRVRVLFVERTD